MIRPLADPVPGVDPISKGVAAAAGRSVPSAAGSLAHAEVVAYGSWAEVAEDFHEIIDRHGEALIAIFEAAGWKTRRCAGRGGLETGAAVSEGPKRSQRGSWAVLRWATCVW